MNNEIKFDGIRLMYFLAPDENSRNKNGEPAKRRVAALALGRIGTDIHIAGSACSEQDRFETKVARSIALNRLRSNNPKTRKVVLGVKEGIPQIHEILDRLRLSREYTQLNQVEDFTPYDSLFLKLVSSLVE